MKLTSESKTVEAFPTPAFVDAAREVEPFRFASNLYDGDRIAILQETLLWYYDKGTETIIGSPDDVKKQFKRLETLQVNYKVEFLEVRGNINTPESTAVAPATVMLRGLLYDPALLWELGTELIGDDAAQEQYLKWAAGEPIIFGGRAKVTPNLRTGKIEGVYVEPFFFKPDFPEKLRKVEMWSFMDQLMKIREDIKEKLTGKSLHEIDPLQPKWENASQLGRMV